MKIALATILVVALAFAALTAWGAWKWRGLTQSLVDRLEASRVAPSPARFDAQELAGLPPVVQRYFRVTMPDGAPIVAAVTVEHTGTFNLGETVDNWTPFSSYQRVVTRRPGFVWDGRMNLLPGLGVRVHDAYVAGEGVLHPTVLGLFTLMELRGTGAVAEGEFMRFFAEAAWYPTALLPSQGVRWEAVDERSARATMTDGGLSLTLTFTFDAQGLMESVRADARGRTESGKIVMRPWEGRWSNHQWREGMRVPLSGEVAWLLPPEEGGRKPYWRGTIRSLSYEWAPY
ncbi:hypothetical protein H010_12434 [Hydrogenophaga taeniospiralis CCUG 15921]|uniref:Uncharacterized protein n=1 Tax=Hydrogenophaga taeniospiralis CCUG 15921 TaxID=1281780 RepID=A0A9X4S870_9BURK|nr:DUF6544 family protein [Hydrogenophaga taeniospiralis]MDG5976067.1 hypothetical protein [Hydrogenophaga taeniospiralis CCUG 15921]